MLDARPATRLLLTTACAAAGLVVLPVTPAAADYYSCASAEADDATRTITLHADCTTHGTLFVEDGWTLDGAGHTLTASAEFNADDGVRNPIVRYAGNSEDDHPTITVRDLRIDREKGPGYFAYYVGVDTTGASATLTGVDIENLTSSVDPVSRGIGILNTGNYTGDGGDLHLSHVTIQHYATYGVRMSGGTLTADHLRIGPASSADSEDPPVYDGDDAPAPAGLLLEQTSGASIVDSALSGNRIQPAPAARSTVGTVSGEGTPDAYGLGSAVHADHAGGVTMTRDTIEGRDSDAGILVGPATALGLTCSSVGRTTSPAADPATGYGLVQSGDGTAALDSGTRFSGWRRDTVGAVTAAVGGCARLDTVAASANLLASRSLVPPGGRFTLLGTQTPAAPGATVQLQELVRPGVGHRVAGRAVRRWRTVARTSESAAGTYRFSRRIPRHAHRGAHTYRASVGGLSTNPVVVRVGRRGTFGS